MIGKRAVRFSIVVCLAAAVVAGLAIGRSRMRLPDGASATPEPTTPAATAGRFARLARPTGRKVLIVGWDGADWLILQPLLERGRLPNLAGLIARGVSGELRSQEPLLSPLLWTTLATGKPVLEHGISDFLVRDKVSRALVPITSSSRRVHALWTVLPAFGLRADVVAWWATWPAEPSGGTMVTDRVAYQLFGLHENGDDGGKVHPPYAWPAVRRRLVRADEVRIEEVRRFVTIDGDELDRLWNSLPPERRPEDRINHLRKVLAATRTYHQVALDLLRDQADLTMVYYEGTDTVGHLFARFLPPRLPGVSEEDVRRFGGALQEFYVHADELLGELLARVDDDTIVLLISDHGFFTGEARPASDPADFTTGAPAWHRLHGVVVAAGRGIRPGRIEGATILDIAPTVLALLGLPLPADLPGKVLKGSLPEGIAPIAAPRLASFEQIARTPTAPRTSDATADEERMRELAALGYIAPPASLPAAPAPPTAAAEGLEAVATEAYNLGRIHQRRGDLEEARRQYEIAIERLPSFGAAWAALAQAAALAGRHCEAFELLVRGFGHSRTMPLASLTGLVDESKRCGRLDEAGAFLERLRSAYEKKSAFHAALGLFHAESGRPDGALAHYERALAIDPLDALAMEEKVALLIRAGRSRDAGVFLDERFEIARGEVTAMNQIAIVALRNGWASKAESLFERILASDPGNPGVLANLAAARLRQGRKQEAIDTMRQAVERDPENATGHFNLGAMLAELGRETEALAAFAAAAGLGMRSPRLHVAAAKMHFRLGDVAASRRELETALRIDPGNGDAGELLAALGKTPRNNWERP